jgi:hypothetical protein
MLDPDSLTERRRRKLVRFWMYRLWYDIKYRRVMEAIRNRAPPSAYKESIHQTNPWLNAARGDVRELTIEATHTGIFQEPGLRRLVEELRSEFGASEPTQGAE